MPRTTGLMLLIEARQLDASGKRIDAAQRLSDAAALGCSEAMAELGLWYCVGHHSSPNPERGRRLLRRGAEAGEVKAMLILAHLHAIGRSGSEPNFKAAVRWLIKAAEAGHPAALRQLAVLLPSGHDVEPLRKVLMGAAAAAGDRVARALTIFPAGDRRYNLLSANTIRDIGSLVCFPHEAPRPERMLIEAPFELAVFRQALPDWASRYIISLGRPFLQQAVVNDHEQGRILDSTRSNSAMSFHLLEGDVVIASIDYRLLLLAEMPAVPQPDPLSLLRYGPGQSYKPHYDYFDPEADAHRDALASGGQRTKTALVYLNNGYGGGHTAFPKIDWSFLGEPGDALLFANVKRNGLPDPETLHAGLPISKGEKLVASKWFRQRCSAHR